MSLFPKRRRTSRGGSLQTPQTPITPSSPPGAVVQTPSSPPPGARPVAPAFMQPSPTASAPPGAVRGQMQVPQTPVTPSSPPGVVPRPVPKALSDMPPPANLLEVRRPSAVPIPREEPEVMTPAPVRGVVDIPPPPPAPVIEVPPPDSDPPPEVVDARTPAPAEAIPAEPVGKSEALVRARFTAEDLIRRPAAPFETSEDDVPEGMATEEQLDNFRELRTRLLAMAAGRKMSPFSTLVVPMTSGAGGSFVARNLAAAFALQDGRAAMLVDCNMKHPTQHDAFRTPAVGLFDFLDEPDVQYDSLLRMTGIPALHLIPAGRARSKFREYFSSAPMRALMSAIRRSDYFVFLDSPPAIGSPDARILSEFADFVILVVGYGQGTAQDIAQTAGLFDPEKFAGVVFNQRG